jgi:hypothetical protein
MGNICITADMSECIITTNHYSFQRQSETNQRQTFVSEVRNQYGLLNEVRLVGMILEKLSGWGATGRGLGPSPKAGTVTSSAAPLASAGKVVQLLVLCSDLSVIGFVFWSFSYWFCVLIFQLLVLCSDLSVIGFVFWSFSYRICILIFQLLVLCSDLSVIGFVFWSFSLCFTSLPSFILGNLLLSLILLILLHIFYFLFC